MTIDSRAKQRSLKISNQYYRDRVTAIQLKIPPFSC